MKTSDRYQYEVEALKVVDQEIVKNWEVEGFATVEEATERAKYLASGYDIAVAADGYNQIVVNKLLYDDDGEHDGAEEVACFEVVK